MVLILFPYRSGHTHRADGGIGRIGADSIAAKGERSGRETDEAALQRRRRARPEPEGRPRAYEGGTRTRDLRVHIERRMSDVQRARHVVMESLAEVRREKRNRDIVDVGVGGMRKKGRARQKG